jgi:hypothetical protein
MRRRLSGLAEELNGGGVLVFRLLIGNKPRLPGPATLDSSPDVGVWWRSLCWIRGIVVSNTCHCTPGAGSAIRQWRRVSIGEALTVACAWAHPRHRPGRRPLRLGDRRTPNWALRYRSCSRRSLAVQWFLNAMRDLMGGFGHAWPDDPKAGPSTLPGHVQTSATGGNKDLSSEIGAANAGMQGK